MVASTVSETSIVNSALIKIGAERINSITETGNVAIIAKERYPFIRDIVLQEHPWNCAIKRVSLGLLTTAPSFEFDNAFQLPLDRLKVLNIEEVRDEYRIEGELLLTNAAAVKIKYIFRQTNTSTYSPMLAETISTRLASDMAYSVTQSRTLARDLFLQYKDLVKQARSVDSQEGTPADLDVNEWLQSRF